MYHGEGVDRRGESFGVCIQVFGSTVGQGGGRLEGNAGARTAV